MWRWLALLILALVPACDRQDRDGSSSGVITNISNRIGPTQNIEPHLEDNVGTIESDEGYNEPHSDDAYAAGQEGSRSAWGYREGVDPINDQPFREASSSLDGESYRFRITVRCVSGNDFRYTFGATRLNGAPAIFKSRYGSGGGFSDTREFVLLQVRADRHAAIPVAAEPRTWSQVSFGRINFVSDRSLPASRTLIIRLPMADTDETILIDQSDESVRAALEPCVPSDPSGDQTSAAE